MAITEGKLAGLAQEQCGAKGIDFSISLGEPQIRGRRDVKEGSRVGYISIYQATWQGLRLVPACSIGLNEAEL